MVAGCAALKFSYAHYGLQAVSYDGKLLAESPKDDLDLSACIPDPGKKGKCIVMFSKDFYPMKQDYLDTKQKLIDCEKQH